MSPIAASPAIGYPDWQRIVSYDSPPLVQFTHPLGSGSLSPSNFVMQHYAYIGGTIDITGGDVDVQLTSFTDFFGVNPSGQRQFTLTSNINNAAQIYIPALGPYVGLVISSVTAGNWAGNGNLFASNRIVPLEFTPFNPIILDKSGATVAATSTTVFYPTDYYAGPANVYFFSPAAIGFYVQFEDSSGNWNQVTPLVSVTAGGSVSESVFMPPGAWRIAVPNAGAATACTLAVTHSATGA